MHSELITLAYNSYSLPYHFLPDSVCIVWVLKSQEILHTSLPIWVCTHQEASKEGPSIIEPRPSLNVVGSSTYITKKRCWNLSNFCTHDHTVELYNCMCKFYLCEYANQVSSFYYNIWNVKQHKINKIYWKAGFDRFVLFSHVHILL